MLFVSGCIDSSTGLDCLRVFVGCAFVLIKDLSGRYFSTELSICEYFLLLIILVK